MKLRILRSAREDLEEGFWFYERQEGGLGDYFLDSLTSDIESLKICAGEFIANTLENIIGFWPNGFLLRCTIA